MNWIWLSTVLVLQVPTTMMDKAFKKKNLKRHYHAEAVTTLSVEFV
jgi:hypothetical protein